MQSTRKEWQPATVTVHMLPSGRTQILPRPKTVLGLLNKLGVKPGTALVIRDNGLLTPDREVLPGDELTVRLVVSSG